MFDITIAIVVIGVLAPLGVLGAATVYQWAPSRRSAVQRARTRREAEAVARERAARLDRERQALLAFAAVRREEAEARHEHVRVSGPQVADIRDVLRANLAAFESAA